MLKSEYFGKVRGFRCNKQQAACLCVWADNCVCRLFAHNAQGSLDKIFLLYGDDISSSCNLRNFITDTIFE